MSCTSAFLLHMQRDLDGLAQKLGSQDPHSIPKTVMFCRTKERAVRLYKFLSSTAYHEHYIGAYHASLTDDTRKFVYRNFVARCGELRCLCATVVFGMVSTLRELLDTASLVSVL